MRTNGAAPSPRPGRMLPCKLVYEVGVYFNMYFRVLRDQVQLPCHIQREFQVHERLFGMMDGACRHLEIGAVVVGVVEEKECHFICMKGVLAMSLNSALHR